MQKCPHGSVHRRQLETPNIPHQGKGQPGSRPHDGHHGATRHKWLVTVWMDPRLTRPVDERCPGSPPGRVHMEGTAKDTASTRGTEERGCQGGGWGWPSEQRGRVPGPWRLVDGALLGGGCSGHTTWCPGGCPAPFCSAPGGFHSRQTHHRWAIWLVPAAASSVPTRPAVFKGPHL